MHYFLWIDEKQQGPYEKRQILLMLLRGTITKQTLCCPEGGGEWNPLGAIQGLLDELSPPPAPPAVSAGPSAPAEPVITRRSGWSRFLNIIGAISLLVGIGGCAIFSNEGGRDSNTAFILFACGVVGALQAFFFAFLVDVFTDTRWFLKQLVEKKGRDDA